MGHAREVFLKMSELRGKANTILSKWENDEDFTGKEYIAAQWKRMDEDQRLEQLRESFNKIMDMNPRNPSFEKVMYRAEMRRKRALIRLGPIDGLQADWKIFEEIYELMGKAVGVSMSEWIDGGIDGFLAPSVREAIRAIYVLCSG
jgi:hypothetical protein